jgi:hypothetical protein
MIGQPCISRIAWHLRGHCAKHLITVAFAVVALTTANAEVASYFGGPDESKLSLQLASSARAAFLSTLSSHGVENVESRSGANPTLSFGSTGITATTGFPNGVNSQFAYAVSGVKFLWDAEGVADWLEFSEPVTAFGSYVVQGGDGSSGPPSSTPANTLTFRLENTVLGTSKEVTIGDFGPDWPFYNVTFVGLTDTEPFNRVSLSESYDHDGLLWDDLIAGNVVAALPGDFDHNDIVDGADLVVWQDHYGETDNGSYLLGDADGDGDTDGVDFLIWQRQYGASAGGSSAAGSHTIPEPSAIWSVLTVIIGAGARCRA